MEDNDKRLKTSTNLSIIKRLEKLYFKHNKDAKVRNTERSRQWFRKYITKNVKPKTSDLKRDKSLWSNKPVIGQLTFFAYDAIHKDTLPVWDQFPMVFFFDTWQKNGHRYYLGLNLHYLPPQLRLVAFKALLQFRNDKNRYRKTTKLIKMEWKILKSMANSKLFAHCIHMYRADAVYSMFINIPADSWEIVLTMPLARWQNANKNTAYKLKR